MTRLSTPVSLQQNNRIIDAAHKTVELLRDLMEEAQVSGDDWVLRRLMEMARLQTEIIREASIEVTGRDS